MVESIDSRLNLARELVQVARDEFAKAEEAKGGAAVIGLRNACGKGWLAALEATYAYLVASGVPESELPENYRGRYYFVGRYMDRDLRKEYIVIRQIFHINGYYEGIVEFEDMPHNFDELDEFIQKIETAATNGPVG